MNRSIPFVLSVALLGPVVFAEDAAQPGQSDAAAPRDAAGASQDAAAAKDPSATASDDKAGSAAGKQSGQQQDPTQMFIKDMYSHNLYEVQVSQLAQQQAQDEQLKQLAEMLIKDHTAANEQLKELAQGAQVQVEEQLDPVHQAKLDKFKQLPQSEFGRKFANDQVAGHMVAVLELQYQSQNAQDEKVKQFATKMLPKMQQHLNYVTKMATQQAGGTGTGSGTGTGGDAHPGSEGQPGDASGTGKSEQSGQDAAGKSGQDAAGKSGQDAAGKSGQDAAGKSGQDAAGGSSQDK